MNRAGAITDNNVEGAPAPHVFRPRVGQLWMLKEQGTWSGQVVLILSEMADAEGTVWYYRFLSCFRLDVAAPDWFASNCELVQDAPEHDTMRT